MLCFFYCKSPKVGCSQMVDLPYLLNRFVIFLGHTHTDADTHFRRPSWGQGSLLGKIPHPALFQVHYGNPLLCPCDAMGQNKRFPWLFPNTVFSFFHFFAYSNLKGIKWFANHRQCPLKFCPGCHNYKLC